MSILTSRAVIKTRFIGPTNYRGARIKATCQAGSVTVSLDYSLSGTDAHWQAVLSLIAKYGLRFGDKYAIGQDESGYYFTPIDPDYNVATLAIGQTEALS
jgi:hypothetical protein